MGWNLSAEVAEGIRAEKLLCNSKSISRKGRQINAQSPLNYYLNCAFVSKYKKNISS